MNHPFTNVPASDADQLLYMIQEAHKPYRDPVMTIGDVASEWVTRWRRGQPKPVRQVGAELNPTVMALRSAYQKPQPQPEPTNQTARFTFEEAAKAIETRWPGIKIGEPERAWDRQPEIVELHRLRAQVQAQDDSQFPYPVRTMVR